MKVERVGRKRERDRLIDRQRKRERERERQRERERERERKREGLREREREDDLNTGIGNEVIEGIVGIKAYRTRKKRML